MQLFMHTIESEINMQCARAAVHSSIAAGPQNVFGETGKITAKRRGGSMAKRKHGRRVSRLGFAILEAGLALVFFAAVVHHVYNFDFKPLAAFCIPVLVVFFGFASLLYTRGRSLAKAKGQLRSLYAAERAVQGTVWYLFGIILGTSLYGILVRLGIRFDPSEPSADGFWLLLFLAPWAFMQFGLLCFMRAAWAVTPHFFRRLKPFEIRRRVQQ